LNRKFCENAILPSSAGVICNKKIKNQKSKLWNPPHGFVFAKQNGGGVTSSILHFALLSAGRLAD
jgi:hypothetical protein